MKVKWLSVRAMAAIVVCLALFVPTSIVGATTTGSRGHVAAAVNLARFRAQVKKFTAVPKFIAPGPAFNAKKAASGKMLFTIPASSAIPFVETISHNMQSIAGEVGINYVEWPNQGQPSQ